jgi:hypothetical protein
VIIGVIGIVAFGSINTGLATETDVAHLTYLWCRARWLGYFFFMSISLILLLIFTSSLDAVLTARSDLEVEPTTSTTARRTVWLRTGYLGKAVASWENAMKWVRERLEMWTAAKGDKQIAWTLGIGWACCGGGLAGGCLVFAKAMSVFSCPKRIPTSISNFLLFQSETVDGGSLKAEPRESIWSRCAHLYHHPLVDHCCAPNHLSQSWPEGV